jgi:hypothetical protein
MVGLTKEKQLSIHLHAVMSAPDMKVYGGHLVVNGNPVRATAEVMIQEYRDMRLVREHDSETGFILLNCLRSSHKIVLCACPPVVPFKKGFSNVNRKRYIRRRGLQGSKPLINPSLSASIK